MKVVIRKNGDIKELKYCRSIKFLYTTKLGRIVLKFLATKTVAKIVGGFMNTRFSCFLKSLITRSEEFDINKFEDINYNNYNKYFTRKYRKEYLSVEQKSNIFISPCEGKLLIFKIDQDSVFEIKNSKYTLKSIIHDKLVEEYSNGYALIFRLNVTDYHRYCYIDDGNRSDYKYISGILHTVQPIVYDKFNVFHENCREWCVLHTENFGDIIEIEVGALLIGKIINDQNKIKFKKGDEKGYFEFGGSTIILLVKDGVVAFDKDILENSKKGYETTIKYGEKIGKKR